MLSSILVKCKHLLSGVLAMSNDKDVPQGRAKGGVARREKLSPERRSEIARNAALAKAAKANLPSVIREGKLKFGDTEIPCYITEDGKRLLSARALQIALGLTSEERGAPGDRVARLLDNKRLSPLITKDKDVAHFQPVKFNYSGNPKPINGYSAEVLADICEGMLEARRLGMLTIDRHRMVAAQCEILMRSFARIGIIALIDEATGYQEVRPKDALQQYLEMLVRKELAVWAKKFPDEFYENIYKLRGWTWPGMGKNRYSVVAHYTRDLVYERMAPGLLKDLEEKSPKDEKGNREGKLHQWLTGDIGDPMLASHLQSILTLQRLAIANGWGWTKFMHMVDQVMKKKGDSLDLPFSEPDAT